MQFQWADLFAGLCFYLVIEGMLAFANPAALKRILGRIVTLDDQSLRRSGIVSVVFGLGLLYWVRG